MSTASPKERLGLAIGNVPQPFRTRIIATYHELKRRHAEAQYESAGLSVGKFCESVLRLLQSEVLGSSTPFGSKIPNFADTCRTIITANSQKPESLRVVVPRALVFLYTMRSKRGIGHVGGDVDANEIDSATMTRVADWVFCELIRVYHTLSLEEAQDLVSSLAYRSLPAIWEVGGRKRVLLACKNKKEEALLLLYSEADSAVPVEDLCQWVEYSSLRDFKRLVLLPLHRDRLVEYDTENEVVLLSPKGAKVVDETMSARGAV